MKKKTPEERKPTKSSLSRWQSLKRFCIIFVLGGSLVCTLGAAAIIAYYSERAKAYDLTKLGDMPERTIVMDAKGVILGRMHGENRIIVLLSEVSPWFVKALLAREDSRFYKHGGVDYLGVARAMVRR